MSYQLTPIRQTSSQDLSAAALSFSYTMTKDGYLLWASLNASVNITETVTVTLDSVDGANYDFVLDTSSLSAAQNYFFNPSKKIRLKEGDKILIECTFANTTGTVYPTLVLEEGESYVNS